MTERFDADERFDEELRRAARSLVAEELPAGVLDPRLGSSLGTGGGDGVVRGRRALPSLASLAGAAAVLILAITVVFTPRSPGGPGASPTASPAPTVSPTPASVFRATIAIRADLMTLKYACVAGRPLSTIEPGPNAVAREAVVCTTDTGVYMAAVILGESSTGRLVEVHMKADFITGDTPAGRAAVASALAKGAAVSVPLGAGSTLGDWVNANAPLLEANESTSTVLEGLSLKLGRTSDGGYVLSLDLP